MSRDRRREVHVIGMRYSPNAPWQRIVFGLTVLAVGIIYWLDRMGRIEAAHYLRWWPVAALAMGVAHLFERRWFGAAIWLIFAGYFFLPLVNIASPRIWYILAPWPLMITAGGIALMKQALRRRGEPSFRAVAVMGGNVRKVGAKLETGEATAVMGACDIDLTSARIDGEAVLDVLAFWGGIGIKVPRGWNVVSKVSPVLAGYDDKTDAASDEAPRLIIRGMAIMGGIEVRHPKESAA